MIVFGMILVMQEMRAVLVLKHRRLRLASKSFWRFYKKSKGNHDYRKENMKTLKVKSQHKTLKFEKANVLEPTKVRSATDIIFTIGGAIRQTEKAVLFKIQNPYGNDFSEFIEKWIPKSVIVPPENQSKEQREFIHKLQADTDEDTIDLNPLVVAEWFSKKLFE